jgi:hypothetical protein
MMGEQSMLVPFEGQGLATVTERMLGSGIGIVWTGVDTTAGTSGVKKAVRPF